ncbi:MAG: hypothetical protein ACP5M4_16090 [Acidobacteriaceae bacterium]
MRKYQYLQAQIMLASGAKPAQPYPAAPARLQEAFILFPAVEGLQGSRAIDWERV